MVTAYSNLVIKWRWLVILLSVVGAMLIASGGKHLTFDNDYNKIPIIKKTILLLLSPLKMASYLPPKT